MAALRQVRLARLGESDRVVATEDPFRRAGWYGWGILAVAAIAVVFAFSVSQAQTRKPAGVYFDCRELADAVGGFADFRDTGADLERVIRMLHNSVRDSASKRPERYQVIEREIRRMWAEGLPYPEATQQLYERCVRQMGDMGRST